MLIRPRTPKHFAAVAAALALALVAALLLAAPAPAHSVELTAADTGWAWPLTGEVITPYKNGSDRYAAGQHRGVDIAAPVGTPARAIVGGKVSYAGSLPDGGITVTVRSSDDGHLVSFLHLASRTVARGASVSVGEVLGAVGMTGKRSAEQSHLHLSVRVAASGDYVDPMTLLGPPRVAKLATGEQKPAAAKPVEATPPQAVALPHHAATRLSEIEPKRVAEHSGSSQKIVHAQSTGDRVPAAARSVGSSASNSARESHASENGKTGRVAPPPLKVLEPEVTLSSREVAPVTANPVAAAPTADSQTAPRGSWRWALIAIALGCVGVLAFRRKPSKLGPSRTSGPVAGAVEDANPTAAPLLRRVQ